MRDNTAKDDALCNATRLTEPPGSCGGGDGARASRGPGSHSARYGPLRRDRYGGVLVVQDGCVSAVAAPRPAAIRPTSALKRATRYVPGAR
jgi:hypothetical protein